MRWIITCKVELHVGLVWTDSHLFISYEQVKRDKEGAELKRLREVVGWKVTVELESLED